MAELVALFTIIALSLLVVRVGTLALHKTGLAREVAGFQAQSAFMGVGFTTAESEAVVRHPVRRRIVRTLMMLGFGAITSTLGTLVVTFTQQTRPGGLDPMTKVLLLLGFVLLCVIAVNVSAFERLVDRMIAAALDRFPALDIDDLHELLNLDKGYRVATLPVEEGSWLEGHTLRQLGLAEEGILVLNIQRASGVVIASPASTTRLEAGDRILVYGLDANLARLRERPVGIAGKTAHAQAVAENRLRMAGERTEDEACHQADGTCEESVTSLDSKEPI